MLFLLLEDALANSTGVHIIYAIISFHCVCVAAKTETFKNRFTNNAILMSVNL